MFRSNARAAAAAPRMLVAPIAVEVEVLPTVNADSDTFVSTCTCVTWSIASPSSSAAIIRTAVGVPWPSSVQPANSVTVLSELTWSHESTWVASGGPGKRARMQRGGRRRVVRGSCSLGGEAPEAEADDERAAPAQERRARELTLGQYTCIGGHVHQLLRIRRRGHHAPAFAITAAAFWIAVRIRGYVPQRHRCPFIAVRI